MPHVQPQTINDALLRTMPLREYSDDASKADYGKLLIIAGSRRLPGPALLGARAALRCGCGTVRVAAPESIAVQLGIALPELMVIPLPETDDGTVSTRLCRFYKNSLKRATPLCSAPASTTTTKPTNCVARLPRRFRSRC
jgi:NAD(P)H-hydrate repair Nnr-like enzyme with NAD(P)H-hydrate dehydratase domain